MDGLINVATITGYVLTCVSGIWILLIAFGESIWQGLFCIFTFPVYWLYYCYTRFDWIKMPLFIWLIGVSLLALVLTLSLTTE